MCSLPKKASAIVDFFRVKRNEDVFVDAIWGNSVSLADQAEVEVRTPRVVGRQVHRANIPANTPQEYWRINLFVPFVDHLISELTDRLCTPLPRIQAQHLIPAYIGQLTIAIWDGIKDEFRPFLPNVNTIDAELELWKHGISTGAIANTKQLCRAIDASYAMFPNINTILRILLTMPVSTASAERSFSCLRRLKTYLRNTQTDNRLSSLALMHIHRERDIDANAVLREFDASGHRRIALAFDD